MQNKNDKVFNEKFVIQFLKKNKNFLLENPELIKILNFANLKKNSDKIIDINVWRSNKIQKDYDVLKKQMTAILKAGSNHLVSQKRIMKTSLKILNTKSLKKLIDFIVNDLGSLLACDIVNCFFTSDKIKHSGISQIDNRLASTYFRDKPQTYLNQNPKGLSIFFPNKSKFIKSYMLIKIIYNSDRFILAMGSTNSEKFTKDQKVDLIEYLIQVTEIKLSQFES